MNKKQKSREEIVNILERQFGSTWESKAIGGTVREFENLISQREAEVREEIKEYQEWLKETFTSSDSEHLKHLILEATDKILKPNQDES